MSKEVSIEESRRSMKKMVAIFGSLFMVAGLLTSTMIIYEMINASLTSSWSKAQGIVLESKLTSRRDMSTTGNNNYVTVYSPHIRYQYEVDGKIYTNDKVRYSAVGGTDMSQSRRYVSRYPVNKTIDVFYSPGDHQKSVLVKGAEKKKNIGGLVAGVLFFLFGFLFYKLRFFMANSIPDK